MELVRLDSQVPIILQLVNNPVNVGLGPQLQPNSNRLIRRRHTMPPDVSPDEIQNQLLLFRHASS
jgi:hypothetical protein